MKKYLIEFNPSDIAFIHKYYINGQMFTEEITIYDMINGLTQNGIIYNHIINMTIQEAKEKLCYE